MHYTLSRGQAKDLLERATMLTIAIPCPPFAVDDARDYVISVLDRRYHAHVKHVEEQEVTVYVRGPNAPRDTTLNALIGPIIQDGEQIGEQLTIQVAAFVVTLDPLKPARHKSRRVQWAAPAQ